MYANRFIPKYCDKKLAWYDRNYDFIDLSKWEEFDKDKDHYISNVNITFFRKYIDTLVLDQSLVL